TAQVAARALLNRGVSAAGNAVSHISPADPVATMAVRLHFLWLDAGVEAAHGVGPGGDGVGAGGGHRVRAPGRVASGQARAQCGKVRSGIDPIARAARWSGP